MTLNGVMALTLRYFNQFAKYAFQLMIGSSSIELRPIDQKSTSVTHTCIAVKSACVTKFTHSRVVNLTVIYL